MKNISEYLLKSCNLMRDIATHQCSGDYVRHGQIENMLPADCNWYHSAWQYLRVLDCVSAPQWHEQFYTEAFRSILLNFAQKEKEFKVIITGTADYSMLYLLLKVLYEKKSKDEDFSNINVIIDILDLCKTPLEICKWYVEQLIKEGYNDIVWIENDGDYTQRIKIHPINMSIGMFTPLTHHYYDVVCTDAFLTRFYTSEVNSIISKWENILSPTGKIITTVRIHSSEQYDKNLADLSCDINKFCDKVIKKFNNLSERDQRKMDISIEDLRFIAFRYIVRMKSNSLGNEHDIKQMFEDAGLTLDKFSDPRGMVDGEIHATEYYRIVASHYCGKNKGRKGRNERN